MNHKEQESEGRLGFINSLGRLFRPGPLAEAPVPEPEKTGGKLAKLEVDFAAAITAMNRRVEEQRRAVRSVNPALPQLDARPQDRASERERRKESCHRAMREDIEAMHTTLGTELTGTDLDEIVAFLTDMGAISQAGRDSHVLLPRARRAIAERLRSEAGELAVTRIVALLQRQGLEWPDPRPHHPTTSPEEIERSRRRRLTEVRESLLAYDFERMAERLQGIVSGWGGDYPDRGSPLWQESVLKGVAAALWGRLLEDFVALLEKDRSRLLSRTEEFVGKELEALHSALESRTGSILETTEAVASSLRVVDEVIPEIAWELVRAQPPRT